MHQSVAVPTQPRFAQMIEGWRLACLVWVQHDTFAASLPTQRPREKKKKHFASSDPHHGIQFIPSDNLSGISIWHSIWHVF